jgi:hypothetical protein
MMAYLIHDGEKLGDHRGSFVVTADIAGPCACCQTYRRKQPDKKNWAEIKNPFHGMYDLFCPICMETKSDYERWRGVYHDMSDDSFAILAAKKGVQP